MSGAEWAARYNMTPAAQASVNAAIGQQAAAERAKIDEASLAYEEAASSVAPMYLMDRDFGNALTRQMREFQAAVPRGSWPMPALLTTRYTPALRRSGTRNSSLERM